MDQITKDRFKELLSVPSKTYQEEMMVEYICSVLDTMKGVTYYRDEMLNIYAKKGELSEGNYYPMFVAHTDTVHQMIDEIVVKETQMVKPKTFGMTFDGTQHESLLAQTIEGEPTGIGGDDKCGVFICLEMLRLLSNVKVGFFVSEETGCHGSSKCDPRFLHDVGYIIQYDAPGNQLITEICSGVRLFEKDGDFINRTKKVFVDSMGVEPLLQSHPYTDVSQLKKKADVSCINFSCGYYNMHTVNEFVVLDDVDRAINLGVNMVNEFGYERQEYVYEIPSYKNFSTYGNLFTKEVEEEEDYYEENEEVIIDKDYIKVSEDFGGLKFEDKFFGSEIFLDEEDVEYLYEYLSTRFSY
jgi:putative aminopeptidase FrvX